MNLLRFFISVVIAISVTFTAQATFAKQTFKDVSTKYEFYSNIEWAVSQGLIKGYSDQTFRPSNYLTEAQFAKILTRYSDASITANTSAASETTLVYNYLRSIGVTLTGHSNSSAVNKTFTRIQVAKAFYTFVEGKAPATNNIAIDWMYDKGLTNGKGVSSNKYTDFGSNDKLKRAHISAFFYRLDSMLKAEPLNEDNIVTAITKSIDVTGMELIQYDRVNFTSSVNDEYVLYFRDAKASLVDQAKNFFIVASFDEETQTVTVLKELQLTDEFMFLERVSLNTFEQMIIWTVESNDLSLHLTMLASHNNAITSSTLPINYVKGSFTVTNQTIIINVPSTITHTYRLSNGQLVR